MTGIDRAGKSKYTAGESCQTPNQHWGRADRDYSYRSVAQMIEDLALCRRYAGNYLLNIGPMADGSIPDLEAAMFRRVGDWCRQVGEVLYRGRPTTLRCEGRDFVLSHRGRYYWFCFDVTIDGNPNVTLSEGREGPRCIRGIDRPVRRVRWCDNDQTLAFSQNTDARLLAVNCTGFDYGSHLVVRVAEVEAE